MNSILTPTRRDILYLASASKKRKELLHEAGIAFKLVNHIADEKSCVWSGDLGSLTQKLAELKMSHVHLPVGGIQNELCWVLTADTLTQAHGEIIGKPRDHQDAIAIIKNIRDGVDCSTGFCIERRIWDGSLWQTQERVTGSAHGWCSLAIADDEIEPYFQALKKFSGFDYLKLAGAFSITGYGAQFLKEVRGNYYAILGLPMAEVRAGLKKLNFSS